MRKKDFPPHKFISNGLSLMERMPGVDKLYQDDLQYFSQEGREPSAATCPPKSKMDHHTEETEFLQYKIFFK